MASDIKLDLYGSTLTRGISTNRLDRARVLGRVSRLTGSDHDWMTTLIEAASGQNPHPLLTGHNLPLASVTATRFGQAHMNVTLDYFRRGTVIQPTSQVIAQFATGEDYTTKMYSQPTEFDGFIPSGPLHFKEGLQNQIRGFPPTSWMWSQPTLVMTVPYELDHSAIADVAFLQNHVNDSVITFNGYNFPIATLLFTSFQETWFEHTPEGGGASSLVYSGKYVFETLPGGFIKQEVFFDGPPGEDGGEWEIITDSIYPRGDFTVFET